MSTNKSISYILCKNKGIIVNLYKLHFPSSYFCLKPNKKVFHPLTFPPLQPNTQERKPNIFYTPTFPSSYNFPSPYFSTSPTKRIQKIKEALSFCIYCYCILYTWPLWLILLDFLLFFSWVGAEWGLHSAIG